MLRTLCLVKGLGRLKRIAPGLPGHILNTKETTGCSGSSNLTDLIRFMGSTSSTSSTDSKGCKKPKSSKKKCKKPLIDGAMARNARQQCKPDEGPKCGPVRIAKNRCTKEKKKRAGVTRSKYWKFWNADECCPPRCVDVRYDDLYYMPSDKNKEYMQTWNECPEIKIRKKKVCCFEKIKKPKWKKREFRAKRLSQSGCVSRDTELMQCKTARKVKCPKMTLRGCRMVRDPPKCLINRRPSDCKKICAPYPSFSECDHPPLRKGKPVECFCLDLVPVCEVYAMLRRMGRVAKGGCK